MSAAPKHPPGRPVSDREMREAGLSKDERRLIDIFRQIPDSKTRLAVIGVAGIALKTSGDANG